MALTPPPTAPLPTDIATIFDARAYALASWLAVHVTEEEALLAAMTALAAGGAVSLKYIFSTTITDTDPTAGHLALDNATQNIATTIRADLADSSGSDLTNFLALLDDSTSTNKGLLTLRHSTDPNKWLSFKVASVASPSGYRNIAVTNPFGSSAAPFSNGDPILLDFTPTGDKGDPGSPGPAATAVDKGAIGSGTVTFDYSAGTLQTWTNGGAHTVAIINWPTTGSEGVLQLIGTNLAAYAITWPTINWVKPDGTTTTSIATYLTANGVRAALQISGVDQIMLWTRDAGATIYGKLI